MAILNMHYTGLAIARSLKDCAVDVYGLGPDENLFGTRSRYCKYVPCPDTETAPEQCRDFLVDFSSRFTTRPCLFPTRDHDLQFLATFYEQLANRFTIIAPPPEMLHTILHKARLYQVAQELGIPVPATAWIDSSAALAQAKSTLRWPVIVKPVYATQWRRKGIWDLVGRRKAAVMHSYDELCEFYGRLEPTDPLVHVQEFIPGDDSNLVVFGSYVNTDPGTLRYFTGRKIIQYPVQSGTGIVVQSCPVPGIVETSARLLQRLQYRGVSEIEYKYDHRSREYVLIEMNPRFWDQHGLGVASGVNLAKCVVADLTEGRVPGYIQDPRPVTWIAEDGFLLSLVSNFSTAAYPFRRYFNALRGPKTYAAYDRSDWRPAARLAAQVLRDARRYGPRRLWRMIFRQRNRLGGAARSAQGPR